MTYDHDKLPPYCASRLRTTNEPILLKSGHKGYWLAPTKDFDVEKFNKARRVTPAQRMAMEIGSIFGFDVPGADPDFHHTTRTTTIKMTTTTTTKARLRKKAKAIMADVFYRELRDNRGLGAGEALATVKSYDSFTLALDATEPADKRSYPSGITRVARGYWVFGH